jgi:hypothetical protein
MYVAKHSGARGNRQFKRPCALLLTGNLASMCFSFGGESLKKNVVHFSCIFITFLGGGEGREEGFLVQGYLH